MLSQGVRRCRLHAHVALTTSLALCLLQRAVARRPSLPPACPRSTDYITGPLSVTACCRKASVAAACMPACIANATLNYHECETSLYSMLQCAAGECTRMSVKDVVVSPRMTRSVHWFVLLSVSSNFQSIKVSKYRLWFDGSSLTLFPDTRVNSSIFNFLYRNFNYFSHVKLCEKNLVV